MVLTVIRLATQLGASIGVTTILTDIVIKNLPSTMTTTHKVCTLVGSSMINYIVGEKVMEYVGDKFDVLEGTLEERKENRKITKEMKSTIKGTEA